MPKIEDSPEVRTQLRMPSGLHKAIVEAAKKSGRSMNAEIIARLEDTFIRDGNTDKDLDLLYIYGETFKQAAQVIKTQHLLNDTLRDIHAAQAREYRLKLDVAQAQPGSVAEQELQAELRQVQEKISALLEDRILLEEITHRAGASLSHSESSAD